MDGYFFREDHGGSEGKGESSGSHQKLSREWLHKARRVRKQFPAQKKGPVRAQR